MAELAGIPNPKPKVIEATEAKTFDQQFCISLLIQSLPNAPWTAEFIGVPYDGKEIIIDEQTGVRLEDLKALAAVDTELAQAMGAVIATVGKYLYVCKAKGIKVVGPKNIEEVLK